jgi:Spy/CpxP family protein refolding chaperone
MKKYGMLVLAFACMLSFTISAQNQPTPPPAKEDGHRKEFKQPEKPKLSAQKRAGYLAVDLELTDAQRTKVQALFEKQDKAREEHKAEIKKMREQEKAKLEADRKANDAEMEKILGTEKFQQFKAKQAERQHRMMEKMKNRRFNGPAGPGRHERHEMPAEKEVQN